VVSEVFELGHQPPGVRFVASAAVPVSAQVVVGLVAFQHPVDNIAAIQDRLGQTATARVLTETES
jgi:hypothetical protein